MSSTSLRRLAFGLLPLLPLLAACHDDVIPSTPPPTSPPTSPGPVPNASFTADPVGTSPGVRMYPVEITGRNSLRLALETTWPIEQLHGANLLLRIDPGAQAQIGLIPGGRCGALSVAWFDTAQPSQWVIEVPAQEGDCSCPGPREPANFTVAYLQVSNLQPGDWRIDLGPASIGSVCDCDGCVGSTTPFYGGTVHVAAP